MPGIKRVYASKRSKSSASKRRTYRKPVGGTVAKINSRTSLGSRQYCEFVYFEPFFNITSTLGVVNTHRFTLSGLFDPNLTGSGHQPTNFDQLMLMFERYCVYEVDYKIIYRANAGSSNSGQICGVMVTDQSAVPLDVETYIENGMSQWSVVDQVLGASNTRTFTGKVDLAKCHGISRDQLLGDDIYKGTANVNPAEVIILNCFMQTHGDSSTTSGKFSVELRFKTFLEGGKMNAIS